MNRHDVGAGVLGLILLATGVGKLLDVRGFAAVIETYQLISGTPALLVAYALPWIELAMAFGLIARPTRAMAGAAAVLFHVGLMTLSIVTILRGIALENCGCFGVFLARPLTWQTPIEDLVLGLFALWITLSARRPAPDRTAHAPLTRDQPDTAEGPA